MYGLIIAAIIVKLNLMRMALSFVTIPLLRGSLKRIQPALKTERQVNGAIVYALC